jgi:hypothetical protein
MATTHAQITIKPTDPRNVLRRKVRDAIAAAGFYVGPEVWADAVMGVFHTVGRRYEDLDVTSLDTGRRQIHRTSWIVASLAEGTEQVEGEPLGYDVPDEPEGETP